MTPFDTRIATKSQHYQVCTVPYGVSPDDNPQIIYDDCVALRGAMSLAKDVQLKRPNEFVFVRQVLTETVRSFVIAGSPSL